MSVSRETSKRVQPHVQRAIEADAKLRKQAQQSVNWPDPKARNGSTRKHDLKPSYVLQGSMAEKIANEKAAAEARSTGERAA